jgi:DDE superfamily endonuclease
LCLISVDGTDCPVKEPRPFDPKIFSEKLNGPGLKYEIGVSIQTCDIVWINGPFKAGRPDKTIFLEDGLKAALCEDECVEVDRGYRGDGALMNPDVSQSRKDRIQKGNVRARHEIVNGRLKSFRILSDVFRTTGEDLFNKHGLAFRAVAVIVQLGFELHGHLYDVTYNASYN